jgi:hypothetical protein
MYTHNPHYMTTYTMQFYKAAHTLASHLNAALFIQNPFQIKMEINTVSPIHCNSAK